VLTASQRVRYFSSMKREDLISLLSLCDALQPHLLTDVLVSVSRRHPDLPIFNSPDWATPYQPPEPQQPRSQTGTPTQPPAAASPATKGKQKHKPATPKKLAPAPPDRFQPADLNEEENPFAVPPSWPQMGRGFYSMLLPEVVDIHVLAEENGEAFSHFGVDAEGKEVAAAV